MEYTMAGQPQEPSWQPGAQDQARAAWPQPSFTPPTAGPPQDTFVFPQPPAYGQPGQPGQQGQPQSGQPGQGYPPPTYNPQDQAQGMPQWQQDQAQGTPQWQTAPPRQRPSGEKGFIGSLFDFSFRSMVTPKIIRVLYVLTAVWLVLLALLYVVLAWNTGGGGAGLTVLVLIAPPFVLVSLAAFRVFLELFMVLHRIYEEVKTIRERGEGQG
jgi:hypothetical protein